MSKKRSVDEYLGFAHKGAAKSGETNASSSVPASDDGAYEDSWYQVLKALADEDDETAEASTV